MKFPDKIYKEIDGDIFEFIFVSQTYDEEDGCIDLIYVEYYTQAFKSFYWNYEHTCDEKQIEIFFNIRGGYYLDKSKLIADGIKHYQRAIEHGKELLKKNEEYLNKLKNESKI